MRSQKNKKFFEKVPVILNRHFPILSGTIKEKGGRDYGRE